MLVIICMQLSGNLQEMCLQLEGNSMATFRQLECDVTCDSGSSRGQSISFSFFQNKMFSIIFQKYTNI